MIFNAPAYDGRVHRATIEGKDVSLVRCAAGGDNLLINAVLDNQRTIYRVNLVDGQVDTNAPVELWESSYSTHVRDSLPPLRTKESYTLKCAAIISLAAVLSNFPEIPPSPAKTSFLSSEEIGKINADLD